MNKFYLPLLFILITACGGTQTQNKQLTQLNQEGLTCLNNGNYPEAVSSFKKALALTNLDSVQKVQLTRNLAVAYFENQQLDSSRYYSLLAGNFSPKGSYHYYLNHSDVFLLDSLIDSALVYLAKSIEMGGETLENCNSLGMIYMGYYGLEHRDIELALEYNRKAFSINPSRMTENLLALSHLAKQNYEAAEYHYHHLATSHPESAEYKLYLCVIKKKLNKESEYQSLLLELSEIDSAFPQAIEEILQGV